MNSTPKPFSNDSVIKAAQRCPDCKSRLFEQFRSYLHRYADTRIDSRLRAKFGASDVVQITLAEAHKGFDSFTGDQHLFRAWLLKIHVRNLLDAKRRYTKSLRRDVNREQAVFADPRSGQPTVSSVLIEREAKDQLNAAVAKLAKRTRELIELRHRDGLGFDEIAVRLNMTSAAARKLWSRTLHDLKKQFTDQ